MVKVAIRGIRCIHLNNDILKILGTHFPYNRKLKQEKNFYTAVTNIQGVMKIWKMGNLTLEGKVAFFKTLTISRIVFQSLIKAVPRHIVNDKKNFLKKLFS